MGRDREQLKISRRGKWKARPVPSGLRRLDQGRLRLLTPDGDSIQPSDTFAREFRSLAYDRKTSQPASVGLKKFFSAGRDPATAQQWDELVRSSSPERVGWISEKWDGRLIIRSVWRGEVLWRTRGELQLRSELAEPLGEVVSSDSPLWDPSYLPDHSLQLELILPQAPIVLRPERADLILVGACENATLRRLTPPKLSTISVESGVSFGPVWGWGGGAEVSISEWAGEPPTVARLQDLADSQPTKEGWVVSFVEGGELKMLRIKATHYVSAQRRALTLSPKKLSEKIDQWEPQSAAEFCERLGCDAEDRSYVERVWERYQQIESEVGEEAARLGDWAKEREGWANKRFRAAAAELGSPLTEAATTLRAGDERSARGLLRARWRAERLRDPAQFS